MEKERLKEGFFKRWQCDIVDIYGHFSITKSRNRKDRKLLVQTLKKNIMEASILVVGHKSQHFDMEHRCSMMGYLEKNLISLCVFCFSFLRDSQK